ncbi:hypothetical protein EJ05DRAFT_501935 [Pseudovirgaria hyperparasitica]|uniref:Uncharacterized protein n=1 Tax=Pseudovirgaria hyperparasitica TaxID=470096 RepID=A0A6A6W2S3_9PEZI|nr:uncharacterized protein EJ05DRAFT_501935 [Pseudovirgaria hyperparasitica]KAF2756429.1 hypothetical protein EJ05DRAFT_501935 [Pseudovirgaria hyperparasitica]
MALRVLMEYESVTWSISIQGQSMEIAPRRAHERNRPPRAHNATFVVFDVIEEMGLLFYCDVIYSASCFNAAGALVTKRHQKADIEVTLVRKIEQILSHERHCSGYVHKVAFNVSQISDEYWGPGCARTETDPNDWTSVEAMIDEQNGQYLVIWAGRTAATGDGVQTDWMMAGRATDGLLNEWHADESERV